MRYLVVFLSCFFSLHSIAQLTSISVETYAVHDGVNIPELAGFTTYHVYADMTSSTDFVSAVYGDSENELIFSSAGTVFQSTPSFTFGNEPNPALFGVLPILEFDSWLTIGMMTASDNGGLINVGMDDAMDSFDTTGDFYIDDPIGGAWFYPGFPCGITPVASCSSNFSAFGGEDNKVLLAQITTDGSFTGVFNVQIFVGGDQENSVYHTGICFSTDPYDVFGCTDPAATNFYSEATVDDLTCIFPCTLEIVVESVTSPTCFGDNDGGFIITSTGAQGSDDFYIFGLTDTISSNFGYFNNLAAGDYYVEVRDDVGCDGSDVITVSEGFCVGCTDFTACNYDPSENTEGGECFYSFDALGVCGGDCTFDSDNDGICDLQTCSEDLNFDGAISVQDILILLRDFGCNSICGSDVNQDGLVSTVDLLISLTVFGDLCDCIDLDLDGVCFLDEVDGCTDVEAVNYDPDATDNNGSCIYQGCIIELACNYNPLAIIDDGTCFFFCSGCTDETACNYDSYFLQDDGSCTYSGCLDMNACNYDANAGCTDNNCQYFDECEICGGEGTLGCTESGACNYDLDAGCDDGSCLYFDECEVCGGEGTLGCTESGACNYDLDAGCDDGTCEYLSCIGCMYAFACNYDSEYTVADNESCEFGTCPGCTDSTACNFNPTVSEDDGSCEYCSCNDCSYGCMDLSACNYYSEAEYDDDSCFYINAEECDCDGNVLDECGICGGNGIAEGECDCEGNVLDECGICGGDGIAEGECDCAGNVIDECGTCDNDTTNDCVQDCNGDWGGTAELDECGVCGGNGIADGECDCAGNILDECGVCGGEGTLGCTESGACNYDFDAGCDDGSCVYPGCMDMNACNYDANAGCDNGNDDIELCQYFDECEICGGDGSSCIQSCLDDDAAVSAVGGCVNAVDVLGCAFYWNDVLISELCPESCNNCFCDNDFNDNGIYDDVEVFGCTYLDAVNYELLATADDGSCLFDDVPSDCPSDIDGDGTVTTQDLLSFLSFFGEICE